MLTKKTMLSSAVFMCLLISSLHAFVHALSPNAEECEPITIPQCKSLPYNETRFRNFFDHLNQRVAKFMFRTEYDALIRANCSKHLLFFLCANAVPICLGKHIPHQHPVRPCRSVCTQIQRDCMPIIRSRKGRWPKGDAYNCNLLPESTTSMCISPESFVETRSDSCAEKCKRQKPMNFKKFNNSDFDFVLRVKLKKVTVKSDGNKTLEVKTQRAIRLKGRCALDRKLKGIRRVLVNTDCNCVQLVVGNVYLVAAHCRDISVNLSVNSLWMDKWKRGMLCKLNKWQRRRGVSVPNRRCKPASSKPAT